MIQKFLKNKAKTNYSGYDNTTVFFDAVVLFFSKYTWYFQTYHKIMLFSICCTNGLFSKVAIEWDFPITFEMARAYQKAKGKYLREFQWQDMSMAVRIEFGK